MRYRSVSPILALTIAAALLVGPAPGLDAAPAQGHTRFELAPSGNEARYRVREQLAGVNFPSDAIGVTTAVQGAVVLDRSGKVIPESSKFVVDITGLKSDQARRDRFIQGQTLQTATHPRVEMAITELRGLAYPFPATGELKFQLVGNLTIKGVTRPSAWDVVARSRDGGLQGTATTSFTFGDFDLTRPRVASVLSVDDKITLECDFFLVPKR